MSGQAATVNQRNDREAGHQFVVQLFRDPRTFADVGGCSQLIMQRVIRCVAEALDVFALPAIVRTRDPVTAPAAAPAEPVKDESKAYYYRGQKYYRD